MQENREMTDTIWDEFSEALLGFIQSKVDDHALALDIRQDVFLKVHLKADSLRDKTKMGPWVYQIARNAIIDYYRSKKAIDPYPLSDDTDEEAELYAGRFESCLAGLINELPIADRDILQKVSYQKMSQKEYAVANDLSYSAAKSRVQRARAKLKDKFVECCAVEADKYGNILKANENCNC